MKKIFFLFGFIIIAINGFCDTIEYWHVYYNDSVVGEYNYFSPDKLVKIDSKTILESDDITVRHWDDSPCFDCKYYLSVIDECNRKLRITETKEFGGKLTLSLLDLYELGQKNKSKRYDFYYWEKDKNGKKTQMKLILQMQIE